MNLDSTIVKDITGISNILGNPYNVILFNDDENPFDAVVAQVVKATKCSPDKAMAVTMEAHTSGKAIAFTGHMERCEIVDSILAGPPLRLRTSVEPSA